MQPPTNTAMMTPVMMFNPMSQVTNATPAITYPSTVSNPVMYQTVAYPSMLPNMMMPQQHQYSYPNVYGSSY